MTPIHPLALIAALALAGCNSSGSGPLAPSIDFDDITAATTSRDGISGLPVALGPDLPTGRTTYTGQVYSDVVSIEGTPGYSILGNMAMAVEFGGPNTVVGSITRVHLIDGITPVERMPGRLTISGTQVGGVMNATATGTLGLRTDTLPATGDTDLVLNMTGDTRMSMGGSAVYGNISGTGTGDVTVDVAGGWYFGRQDN